MSTAWALAAAAVALAPVGRGQQALVQSAAAYRALAALHEKVTVRYVSRPAREQAPNETVTYELKMRRPNRIWLRVEGPDGKVRQLIVCDGKTWWEYSGYTHTYTEEPAPASFAGRLDIPDAGPEFLPLFSAASHLGGRVLEPPSRSAIGKTRVDVIRLRNPGGEDLTVSLGVNDHLLRSARRHRTDVPDYGGKGDYRTDFTFDLVDPRAHFADDEFRFQPPE